MIVRQYAPCSLGRSIICLGKQGEINAMRVEFDVSAWMAMYPDATVKLMHFAPDRPQDKPVIPTLGVDGTLRVWIVGEEDTAGAGNGVIELLLIDERTGSTIKSATGYTTVLRSPSAGIEAQEAEAGYVRYDVDQSALLTDEQKAVARKNIGAGTGDDTGSGGILKETDPTVPAWAKQPSKPTYTAGEVGARPDSWTPSASEVGADAAGTASGAVAAHNVSGAAHADLRALIEGLTSRLNALADSDDTTLDQLSEIVAYIKSNRTLIDAVTTGKVSVSDIVDNLTTNASGKVLSAAQGVALKAMIDGIVIPTALPNPKPITINGQRYDGSEAVTVTVSSEGGGTPVEIDGTLTQSGKAADAKAVGDRLRALNEANAAQDTRLTALEQAGGIVTVEPAQDDVPIVFFGGDLPQTKTDTVMPFKYVSKTKTVSGYVETKAQGNSSMSYPKKNQTVKMYADETLVDSVKVDFKGWGAQKKHVYKANWIDLTHSRNVVSAQLWGDVVKSRANYLDLPELLRTSPNQGAIDGFPVLVYANGVYQGRYTINIPKDGWMANMDKTLDTHCILCGENYVSGCFRAAANINGSDWSDELHDTVPDAIKTRWNEVISFVMNSTDDEFKVGLSDYFYIDSLIDYLLFALASCGLDSMGKNQIYMTYDGQKWIASMYDMDSTWGLYWNGSSFVASDYARTSYEDYVSGREGNLLYIRLEQNFHAEIQARWAELKAGPLSYANIMTRFERFIGIVPPHIVKEDYASTTGGGSFTGIPSQSTNHIQQIRAFAIARQAWTDEYVAALTPEVTIPCTGITLDQTELTFTAAGTQTLMPTVIPENTTDTVVWSSDAPSIASVSNGVVKAKANGSATITATCGAYSATCAVSVSGVEAGEDILYQLAEPMTFNGTSDYIDTGVKLLESDIDHSIVFSAVAGTGNTQFDSIFHCMTETSPYPGYTFSVNENAAGYKFDANGEKIANLTYIPNEGSVLKVTITHIKDSSTITMKILYNGEVKTYTANNSNYTTVPQNLLIGCYQTTTGSLGRYWNGTINDFRIYNRVLSAEEITAYLSTPCTGITLDQTELTFSASGTQTLTATVTPSDTTDEVVWSTSADTVATVSGGVVTAVGNGSATITAACGAYNATCAVSVSGITAEALPSGYTAVECIKSNNGESWIDTGYIPAANTGAEYKVYVGKNIKFGFTGIRATGTVFLQITDASTFIVGRRGKEKIINGTPFESMYEASMFVHDDTFVINSVQYDALQVGESADTQNIRIGGAQNGSSKADYKIYYVRFYEGGNLVKNYVPCKNADGVAGLYETVNGDFLTSVTSTPYAAEE